MDKPNKELLQAFIDWFMREYSNFGGKPIAERYEEAFDTFNNDFIDARYDAFQDGWKVQQAKVEELQKRVDAATRKWVAVTSIATTCPNQLPDEFFKKLDELHDALCGAGLEQAPKGEGATNLNIDEKGECRHFSTTMFHEGKAECFHCDAVVNEEREVIGKQSKGFSWTGKEHEK